jgi:signal transduction histidine kinase
MNVKDIDALKRNINISTIVIFLVIFISALAGLFAIHKNISAKRERVETQQIISAHELYKANLSEKLGIIASSTIFMDYLRSGTESRKRLYYQFYSTISSLKTKSISGMQITDSSGTPIFSQGTSTNTNVTLKLCYLNQALNSAMGDCRYDWTLFFNTTYLQQDIQSINKDIKNCPDCTAHDFFAGKKFSAFPIKSSTPLLLKLIIDNNKDNIFYIYLFIMTLTLIIFGTFSWYRLSSLMNNFIAHPIKKITNSLKDNSSSNEKYDLEEIQYLNHEISSWKTRLNKIKADENAAKLGKIAAQLAHDVRSPVSAIDMIVKNLTTIPENYKTILNNATQRISDIANNFLSQYKNPDSSTKAVAMQYIPDILESMVSEKRMQYIDRNIKLTLSIDDNAQNSFSIISHADFKRLLSNLINNAIEAITHSGFVNIHLTKLNTFLKIDITDNGCGIEPELLPAIKSGGISLGKKNGNGLGLSHAIQMMEEWGGKLDINSNINAGTTISISLPLADRSPAKTSAT